MNKTEQILEQIELEMRRMLGKGKKMSSAEFRAFVSDL